MKGIRCYFDKALPMVLLYKKERKQYSEAVVDNVSPSTIYGAEHLLRLFGMFITAASKCVLERRILCVQCAHLCLPFVLGYFLFSISFILWVLLI